MWTNCDEMLKKLWKVGILENFPIAAGRNGEMFFLSRCVYAALMMADAGIFPMQVHILSFNLNLYPVRHGYPYLDFCEKFFLQGSIPVVDFIQFKGLA